MQWVELSADEIAFLTAPESTRSHAPAQLETRLALTLRARLRLPVALEACDASPSGSATAPSWEVGRQLSTLWLTRRLGGRDALGEAAEVPRSLIRSLDAVLAECWLDAPDAPLFAAFAWKVTAGATRDRLAVQLPPNTNDMTRWAREVIRHGG